MNENTKNVKTIILPLMKDLRRVLKKHNLSIQIGERGSFGSRILIGDVCQETQLEKIETLVCDLFDNDRRILSESYLNETINSLEDLVKKNK
jgi:hypothetical protein